MNIRIDPEFKDYLGPLDDEAKQSLEASIKAERCRDALVVWPQPDHGAILLDGHNRLEICERLGIAYSTVDCPDSVIDRAGAVSWIVQNQRARRNLTPDQIVYLRGKLYRTAKETHGGDRRSGGAKSSGQNVHLNEENNTAQRIGREFCVNEKTIRRNAEFTDQVDAIAAKYGPEAKAEILARRKSVSDFISAASKPARALKPEKDAVSEPESAAETPPVSASAPDGKPPEKDLRDMDETESLLWAAKNLPITMDSGAKEGPIYFAEATGDNLADPEAMRRQDSSAMKHILQLDTHIGQLPSTIERENPNAERCELYATRLSRHLDALQAIIATLEKKKGDGAMENA